MAKRNLMKTILFGLLLTVLGGCASTTFKNITSQIASGTHYQKFIVHSNLADPNTRQIVEDAVVRQLKAIGVSATASYTVFPAGNTIPWEEKKKTIQADGFDAGLLVQVVDSYSKSMTEIFANHSLTDIATAHFKIQTKIVDARGFTVVWQAQSHSREAMADNGDFSVTGMMDNYATTLVGELQNEGVVVGTTGN